MIHFSSSCVRATTAALICTILAGGFLLGLILPAPPAVAADPLFFSEYVEGAGYNKAVEIYNGSNQPLQLSDAGYAVYIYFNGNDQPGATISLSGTVAAGGVYVLADDDADPTVLTTADQTYSGSFFNGDDTVALFKDDVLVDVIGQIGVDPGSEWGTGSTSTKDNTIRRQPDVLRGDSDGSDPFDPALAWTGFAKDTFDGLGRHTINSLPDTPTPLATDTPTPTPTATGTPTATPIAKIPAPGDVVINEIVTDPQQDWSSDDFSGLPGSGPVTDTDEYIELYIKADELDLTGWQLELLDSSPVIGDLTTAGAFQTVRYLGQGSFTQTVTGDLLVLGNVASSGALNNDIWILLKDADGVLIDAVELGRDPAADGPANGAPDGTGRGGNAADAADEAVYRYPHGTDTDNHPVDFIAGPASPGQPNLPPPLPTSTPTPTVTNTPTALPSATPTPTAAPPLLISEILYDGQSPATEGDEFAEICNPNSVPVDVTGYKVGDEETAGGGEGMYYLPDDRVLPSDGCLVIAKDAAEYQARFNQPPDFDLTQLDKYSQWASGNWSLANTGDEVVLLGPADTVFDSVAFRNGDYAGLGLAPDASAPAPHSLHRIWPQDTDAMPSDFLRTDPAPRSVSPLPAAPAAFPAPATLPDGMFAYWGDLHAHTTYSDGSGPPHYALAAARAAGLHFSAVTDHGWWLSDDWWAKTLTQTQQATSPGQFVALRGLEWTHPSAGHINLFNTNTRLSRTNPLFDTLPDLYDWLNHNPAVIAQFNHPGTNYDGYFQNFEFDSLAAPSMFMQEIGNHAQGYQTYEAQFVQNNLAGWQVAPTNNSDTHAANWGTTSSARTGLVAPTLTQADLLVAMRARRVFATEDSNLALALRSGDTWFGSTIDPADSVPLTVYFSDPDTEPATLMLYDGNLLLESVSLTGLETDWSTTVRARPGHFLWAKLVQSDGDTAWSAPLWVSGSLEPEPVLLSEILPAPYDWDWNGDGIADFNDEWFEVHNPTAEPVGLGGWRFTDASDTSYTIPLGVTLPPHSYFTFHYAQTGLGLNNEGDTISLIHPNGTVVDAFTYAHSPGYDESWCRVSFQANEWSDDCGPSPTAANWEKVPAGPLSVDIFQAKRLTYNAWLEVKGQVTAPPGVFGNRQMYIQDEGSGIMVYLPADHGLSFNLGDKVMVEGNLRTYRHEFEVAVDEPGDVTFMGAGAPVSPLPIATTSLLEPYEGMLVMLQGQAVDFKGRTRFWLDDGTDPAQVYLKYHTGIRKPYIEAGTPLTAVGIVSQYTVGDTPTRADYRLLPRYQNDVAWPETPTQADNWPLLLPETGY